MQVKCIIKKYIDGYMPLNIYSVLKIVSSSDGAAGGGVSTNIILMIIYGNKAFL